MPDNRNLAAMRAYYERGQEEARLADGAAGQLEFERTKEIVLRDLPPAPALVADIGGGPGRYTHWLAGLGYQVAHRDLMPLHVAQVDRDRAADAHIDSAVADARDLDLAGASVDAVLLLGPLYHLPEREERLAALREARRVVRPGGAVVVATINRFAGLHDTIRQGVFFEGPERRALIEAAAADGVNRISERQMFTTAYFHQPECVVEELTEAGLQLVAGSVAQLTEGAPRTTLVTMGCT